MTNKFETYKDYEQKIKIIKGNDEADAQWKVEKFKKAHKIVEIKQYSPLMIFIFYVE